MKCPRCQGLMVIDTYLNLESDKEGLWVKNFRCLNCGETVDQRIAENRRRVHAQVEPQPLAPPRAA